MISDVLSEASGDIRDYLRLAPRTYPPGVPLTQRIEKLAAEMDAVRAELDSLRQVQPDRGEHEQRDGDSEDQP